jgi:hypothetical protein
MIVVYGVEKDAFVTKDLGARSRSDVLRIEGIKDQHAVGALLTSVADYESLGYCGEARTSARRDNRGHSMMEQLGFLRDNPQVEDVARYAHSISSSSPFKTKSIAILLWLLDSDDRFVKFMTECRNGGGGVGSPSQSAYKLMMRSKAKEIARIDYEMEVRLIVHTFKMHLDNREASRVSLSHTSPVDTKVIQGLRKRLGI